MTFLFSATPTLNRSSEKGSLSVSLEGDEGLVAESSPPGASFATVETAATSPVEQVVVDVADTSSSISASVDGG